MRRGLLSKEKDNDGGWHTVRDWRNKRIIEGHMTRQVRDLQGDYISLDVFMKRMDWIAENAEVMYKHGNDPKKGAVPLGKILAWKRVDDKIKIRVGIKDGSEIIDDIWKTEIQPYGENAGFSIGGAILDKTCHYENGRQICDVKDIDVVEVSWTPSPANTGARVTYVDRTAKSKAGDDDMDDENDDDEREMMQKPFGPYKNFDDCVGQHQDKKDPEAYCATIMRAIEKGEYTEKISPLLIGALAGLGAMGMLSGRGERKQEDDRPSKAWWNRCVSSVSETPGVKSPESLCGWIWYHQKKEMQKQKITPPDTGELPEKGKKILADVYSECREKWVEEHPKDRENKGNKEKCAKIAWSAVERAGFKQYATGAHTEWDDGGTQPHSGEPSGGGEDLRSRVDQYYKSRLSKFPRRIKAEESVRSCGVCDKYVSELVRENGMSVSQALVYFQKSLDEITEDAKTTLDKKTREEKTMRKRMRKEGESESDVDGDEEKPEAEEEEDTPEFTRKKISELEARIKELEARINDAEHDNEADEGEEKKPVEEVKKTKRPSTKDQTVGTGELPLKGIETKTPEEIDRKLMATTKDKIFHSDAEMIGYLTMKGYKFEGIQKGMPDNVPQGEDKSPSGLVIDKTQKDVSPYLKHLEAWDKKTEVI